jgi:hypothetical protein
MKQNMDKEEVAFITHISNMGNETIASTSKHLNDSTTTDCFVPVLSQMELWFLTALAAKNKCIPKTGDITQAFCLSYLPKVDEYGFRPPAGCPPPPPPRHLLETEKDPIRSQM